MYSTRSRVGLSTVTIMSFRSPFLHSRILLTTRHWNVYNVYLHDVEILGFHLILTFSSDQRGRSLLTAVYTHSLIFLSLLHLPC